MSVKNEFCQIFESELKRKLSERAKSTLDEIRLLLNSFKFYDLDYIGIIDKIQWVKGILKTGLTGISETDLVSLFPFYDQNNSGLIDYKNFANYLYGREPLNPLPKNPNIDVFRSYNINDTNNQNNTNINYINGNTMQNNNNSINNYAIKKNEIINNNNYLNNNELDSIIKLNKYANKKVNNYTKQEEMKKFFDLLLEKFKSRINVNNGITFFIFVQKLKAYEINNKINLNDLIQIFKEMRLDFTEIDIKNFFYMLDINEMNFINIDDIINKIKGEMNEERKLYVISKFDLIDKSHRGEININYLKIIYKNNAKFHPDVIQGIKSPDIIFNQFRQTLEMFLDVNKILNGIITKEQFVDYYSAISASIPDDIYFQDILNGIYDLSKLYNLNNNDVNNNYRYYKNETNNYNLNSLIEKNNNNYNNVNRNNYYHYNNERNKKYMSKSISTPQIISEKYVKTPYINNSNIRNNLFSNNLNNYKSNAQSGNSTKDNNRYNQNNKEENLINNNANMNSISDPYYRPRITPGEKGIRKFKKIIYNPITKELLYSNNFNNKYNDNIQNQNVENDKKIKTPMKRYKNNIYLFDEDKYKQQKLIELFNHFRNIIKAKGEKTIFTLQKILYDFNTDYHPNLISFDNFCTLFQKLNINNFKIEEIRKIFEIFDNNNLGYIDYDNFFNNLVGHMGRERETIVRKIYDGIKKDQNGNIFVVDFKKIFNGGNYNEIFGGEKTKEYIYYEFIDNLDIFLNYRNKLYNRNLSNILSYDDFLRFFNQISMYINNDDDFEKYINSCWSFNNNKYNQYDKIIYNNNRKYNNSMIRTGSQIINW